LSVIATLVECPKDVDVELVLNNELKNELEAPNDTLEAKGEYVVAGICPKLPA
jgi:hypothetical protein